MSPTISKPSSISRDAAALCSRRAGAGRSLPLAACFVNDDGLATLSTRSMTERQVRPFFELETEIDSTERVYYRLDYGQSPQHAPSVLKLASPSTGTGSPSGPVALQPVRRPAVVVYRAVSRCPLKRSFASDRIRSCPASETRIASMWVSGLVRGDHFSPNPALTASPSVLEKQEESSVQLCTGRLR